MSNKNFKNISSGTAGAFNTGFVAKAGVVGSKSTPTLASPFTVIDVTVDVGALGTVFPVIIRLGDQIPVGSIVTQASINGRESVVPGTTATYKVGMSSDGKTAIGGGLYFLPAGGTAVIAEPTLNAGILVATNYGAVQAGVTYPVLEVDMASDTVGNLNVKIVYVSA